MQRTAASKYKMKTSMSGCSRDGGVRNVEIQKKSKYPTIQTQSSGTGWHESCSSAMTVLRKTRNTRMKYSKTASATTSEMKENKCKTTASRKGLGLKIFSHMANKNGNAGLQIGRASCRERV